MSQHPSRPPGGNGGAGSGSGAGWLIGRPGVPSPFRPASPHPQARPRGPATPIHHHPRPMSPLAYSGMMHPMSPVPIGMPISPGMSPVFGCPTTGYIQCPRPRWPSPIPALAHQAPRPFIPTQSPLGSGTNSPLPCAPPEYLIAPYRSDDYEYIRVTTVEYTQTDEESSGPSTAEIIASQSQDYVDEKLAEYQATIQQLQASVPRKLHLAEVERTGR